jgi:predicted outer membrane repeat protein
MKLFWSHRLVLSSRVHSAASLRVKGTPAIRGRLIRIVAVLASVAMGAAGARATTCTVSSTADTNTSGTLRYCLNNQIAGSTVTTNVITITATGTITLTSPLASIENGMTIAGPGASQLTISGAGSYQILQMGTASTPTVSISGLTFANGNASNGGAIYEKVGTLTVSDCAFSGNTAGTSGGAIFSESTSTLTVTGSVFTQNSATSGDGGALGGPATLTANNNTLYDNSAGNGGGAIEASTTARVTNNTFYGNSAAVKGDALLAGSGGAAMTADNNLFVGNTGPGGAIANDGTANASYNVFYNNGSGDCSGCTSNANATDVPANANPLTLPLAYYGGPTKTMLPLPGSAAICAGSASLASAASLSTDQRGFAMNPSYTSCTSGLVDAGAVQTNYIQVQSNGGALTTNGSGDCQGTSCTLTDAVALANSNGYGDIDFASGVTSITQSAGLTLTSTNGVNIIGNGANSLTVNGGGPSSNFTVFTVNANVPALIYGLTIANGNTTTNGGGINNSGSLTLAYAAVSGNSAGNEGGGIYSGSGSLTVVDSTISGNSGINGGGIYTVGGTATIRESTIADNSTPANTGSRGAGIFLDTTTVSIVNSTIADNAQQNASGSGGGGIYVNNVSPSLANTIVSGNTDINGPSSNILSSNVVRAC